MVIDVRLVQSANAVITILFTESGIVIDSSLPQSLKIPNSMVVKFGLLLGSVTDVRLEQRQKAHSPILFTESGMTIDVRFKQSLK